MTVILSLLFIASLVQSIAGFGFGMMFVPLGLMLLEPSLVVPVSVISSTCLSAILVATHYKKSRFKQCLPMLIAGILTTPIGAKALVLLNGDLIKLGIALLMIITSIAMIKGLHILIAKEKLGFIIVGLMSGFVGGLCGIGAPPVVLFLVNQNIKKEVEVLSFEDQKVKDVVAQIHQLQKDKKEVTAEEIDALLEAAQKEITMQKLYNEATNKVDANALLQSVENDLEQSFRAKVFEAIKSGYESVKTAVAERNN